MQRASSNDLDSLFSFIAEGLIVFDASGRITAVNPHATLLLDYTSKELMGKELDRAFRVYEGKKLLPLTRRIGATVLQKKRIFTTPKWKTIYFASQSKRIFPVFVSAKPMRMGGHDGGVVVFRDITTEKELTNYRLTTARKLAKLTPLLQKTAMGDFSKRVSISRNEDEFTELFVGLNLMIDDLEELEKTRKEEEQKRLSAVKKVAQEKRRLTERYSHDLEKKVRQQTEEIRRSKAHTETIIENLTVGLIEYDAQHRVVRMNRAAENILGIGRKSVIGKAVHPQDAQKKYWQSLVAVTHPLSADKARVIDKKLLGLAKSGVRAMEVVIQYPIDRELQVITVPLTAEGTGKRIRGSVKVLRDVTRERVIARSKSEFISIAAHQLRTPLSAVKWAMSMIAEGDMGALNDDQRKLLQRGYDTNEKTIALVNDLLNVARIEDGRFGYAFSKNDFGKTIEAVAATSQLAAKEKNVLLRLVKPREAMPPFVYDPDKIALALQNLVDNAIKYTSSGKTITITIKKNGVSAEVAVQDEGVGIPQNQIERLFTKFFRASNVIHMQTSGSGLGLFIVKNIAKRHGGSVHVVSKENEGSIFTLILPLQAGRIPKEDTLSDY